VTRPRLRIMTGHGALVVLFVATVPFVNPYIRGDGNGYFAYVRSAVIDGDLQFENEFRRGDPAFRSLVFDEAGRLRPERRTPTGHVWNQWAVGPALVWLPPFLLAHAAVRIASVARMPVSSDGYSAPYRWSCAVVTAICGFGAVLLGLRSAERFAPAWAATAAAFGIWLASPLPVYMYFLPFHVHALAAFSAALFCWYWLRTFDGRSPKQWFVWGLLGGFMVTIYQIQMALWVVAIVELARLRGGSARLTAGGAFGVGAVVALLPHLAAKWILNGSPFVSGYRDEFMWLSPRLLEVALATEHGMFVWTPVLLIAFCGLLLSFRYNRAVAAAMFGSFAALYYVVASYQNWHGLSSFGNRFFVSLTPLFIIALAMLLDAIAPMPLRSSSGQAGRSLRAAGVTSRVACVGLLALLSAWNAGLMFQWGTDIIDNRGPVSFRQVIINQFTVVPHRLTGFLHRYFTDRTALTHEVEQQDLVEAREFQNRR
jgi:hypothetical protein